MANLDSPIDFDPAARRRLVESQGDAIRALLGKGFDLLVDRGLSLEPFGFPSTLDAVDWAIDRFATAQLDPLRLRTRNWRLFTQGRFWLSQKVGIAAFKRICAEQGASGPIPTQAPVPESPSDSEHAQEELQRKAGVTLGALHRLVKAPGLIADWLEGTKKLRRDWFVGLSSSIEAVPYETKKEKSVRKHDAMFRYQCVAHDLVDAAHDAERAQIVAWLFSPSPNTVPFRAKRERELGTRRHVEELRRDGIAALLVIIADELKVADERIWDLFRRAHASSGITLTTLHLFSLDARDDYADASSAVRAIGDFARDPARRR